MYNEHPLSAAVAGWPPLAAPALTPLKSARLAEHAPAPLPCHTVGPVVGSAHYSRNKRFIRWLNNAELPLTQ